MKKSTNNIIIEFLGLIIGCMFMGVGLNMFFKPYTIAPGGLSGLSLVISKFTGLSVSTIMLLIGIPLLVFGLDDPHNIIRVLNGEKIGETLEYLRKCVTADPALNRRSILISKSEEFNRN